MTADYLIFSLKLIRPKSSQQAAVSGVHVSPVTCDNSPPRDAAPRTDTWRPPGVVLAEKDRDTPSEGDYMGGKLKT